MPIVLAPCPSHLSYYLTVFSSPPAGLRHIVPPKSSSGPSDLNTWNPGWQGSNTGATVIDLDSGVGSTAAPSKYDPSSPAKTEVVTGSGGIPSEGSGGMVPSSGASGLSPAGTTAAAGAQASSNKLLVITVSAVAGETKYPNQLLIGKWLQY